MSNLWTEGLFLDWTTKTIKNMAKVKPILHWYLGLFFFLACLWAKAMTKTPYTDTRASNVWMEDEICTIFYHLHFQKWEGMTSIMIMERDF